jgi:hypothetical protein
VVPGPPTWHRKANATSHIGCSSSIALDLNQWLITGAFAQAA